MKEERRNLSRIPRRARDVRRRPATMTLLAAPRALGDAGAMRKPAAWLDGHLGRRRLPPPPPLILRLRHARIFLRGELKKSA